MPEPPLAPIAEILRSLVQALRSDRPLVVLDVETTGTSVEDDRIVQVGWLRVEPVAPYPVGSEVRLVNPGRSIPAEATAIHGITDAHVAAQPSFCDLAPDLARALAGADLVGYNLEFDRRFLEAEFARAGIVDPLRGARVIDPLRIWQHQEPRDLASALRHFCGIDPEVTHRALEDAEHAARVLEAQLRRYTDLDARVEALDRLSDRRRDWIDAAGKIVWRDGAARINFGRHRGVALPEVDRSYLDWMLDPARDFPEDVRAIVRRALQGHYPERPARRT